MVWITAAIMVILGSGLVKKIIMPVEKQKMEKLFFLVVEMGEWGGWFCEKLGTVIFWILTGGIAICCWYANTFFCSVRNNGRALLRQ